MMVWAAYGFRVQDVALRRSLRIYARPADCSEKVWAQIIEAERVSREKRYGNLFGTLGTSQETIEANQLRIWEELKRRKNALNAGEELPQQQSNEESGGLFANLKAAWKTIYEEADAMGYAQAVALSSKLENRGLLPRVVTKEAADMETAAETPPPKAKTRRKGSKSRSKARRSTTAKGFG